MLPPNPRILIIKPSALGDVATALPMLCDLHDALREQGGARIDWLVHPAYAAVLQGHDALAELLLFDRKRLGAWWYKPGVNKAFRELVGGLRRKRYDCVIDAQGLLRSGFFARITGAPVRIGFASAREGATLAYTHKVALPEDGKRMLAVDRMRALLTPLGVDISRSAHFRLPVETAAVGRVAQLLSSARGDPAVVIPGARWDTKRWSPAGFAEIIARLHRGNVSVVVAGSPDERPLCEEIAAKCVQRTLNLAGQTTLAEMIALIARARVVIGNDSGPIHLAAALGRPVVALYGPTDPGFVGPYGQLDHVVRFNVDCHPCRHHTCDHHSCMNGLTVDMVWNKMQEVLHGGSCVAHI